MKFLTVFVLIAIGCLFTFCVFGKAVFGKAVVQDLNLQPMYGGKPPSAAQKRLNDEAVAQVLKQVGGNRQKAFDETIKSAWYYFYDRKDALTAMKRFNQAWLIDSSNNEVFYGFGFLMATDGKVDEAIQFFKKALQLKPKDSMAAARLGACFKDKAYEQFIRSGSVKDPAVKTILAKSLALFDQIGKSATFQSGLRETNLNDDLAYVFYQWAVVLEFDGQYAKAWEKVHLALNFGGEGAVEKGFLDELSALMPDPQH